MWAGEWFYIWVGRGHSVNKWHLNVLEYKWKYVRWKEGELTFWRIILKDCMKVYRDKTFGEIDLFSVYDIWRKTCTFWETGVGIDI